jgi:hypothetical protein
MDGGQSQTDTWDPKPGSASQGPFKAIDTSVPGIKISEHLPRCASQMERMAILRSMSTYELRPALASWLMHVGFYQIEDTPFPPIGTILARDLGKKEFPLPKYVAMNATSIPESDFFGEEYQPFNLVDPRNPFPDYAPSVPEARAENREALLAEQTADWEGRRTQQITRSHQAAARAARDLQSSPLLRTLDLSSESDDLRRLYGPGFGERCLLARRLAEAGCPFIEIGLPGWGAAKDYFPTVKRLCGELDSGLGALLLDMGRTGLLDQTLIVCAGPYGRTPSTNDGRGRDASATGWSVVLAGGPIQGGRTYGDTGPDGRYCRPAVSAHRLFNTIYTACGINPNHRLGFGYCVDRYTYPNTIPVKELLPPLP